MSDERTAQMLTGQHTRLRCLIVFTLLLLLLRLLLLCGGIINLVVHSQQLRLRQDRCKVGAREALAPFSNVLQDHIGGQHKLAGDGLQDGQSVGLVGEAAVHHAVQATCRGR